MKFKKCTEKGGTAHKFEWLFDKNGEVKAIRCTRKGCSTLDSYEPTVKEVVK